MMNHSTLCSGKHPELAFSTDGSQFLLGWTTLPARDASAASPGPYDVPSRQNERNHMPPVLAHTNSASTEPRLRPVKKDRIPFTIRLSMDPKVLPTRELLDGCLQTNGAAVWAEFAERTRPTIQGVIYKRLCRRGAPDPELIQDLTNATYVKLLPALPRFQWQGEAQFFGWVKQTALSAVGDWVRKLKPEEPEGEALNTVEDPRSSEEQVFSGLRCREIEERVKGTNATEKEIDIFWFYYRQGYTAKEIANMPAVNLTEKQVETILARIVRQVRREILEASAGE